jgi:hypothetical protein
MSVVTIMLYIGFFALGAVIVFAPNSAKFWAFIPFIVMSAILKSRYWNRLNSPDCSSWYRWFDCLTRFAFMSLGLTVAYMVFAPMWGFTPELVKLWGVMFFIVTASFLWHRSPSSHYPSYGWPLWLTNVVVGSIIVVLTYNLIASEGYS